MRRDFSPTQTYVLKVHSRLVALPAAPHPALLVTPTIPALYPPLFAGDAVRAFWRAAGALWLFALLAPLHVFATVGAQVVRGAGARPHRPHRPAAHHGHGSGDSVLREVARRLTAELCPGGRGIHRRVVAPNPDVCAARALVKRLPTNLEDTPVLGLLRLTLSAGAASSRSGDLPAALVARADEALYRTKRSGPEPDRRGGAVLTDRQRRPEQLPYSRLHRAFYNR